MTDKMRELNATFFQIFDDLNEARPVLKGIDEAFTCFSQNILNEYKSEYMRLKAEERIQEERALYKLQRRTGELVPRTWRNWKKFFKKEQNVAKTLLDEEIERETRQFFEDSLKRLSAQEDAQAEEDTAPKPPEDHTEEHPTESVRESAPVTRVEVQQLIAVYVAGYIPSSVIELEAGADQPSDATTEIEDSSDSEDSKNGEVETEVEEFDESGIDTEYEIVEDGEEEPETTEEGEGSVSDPTDSTDPTENVEIDEEKTSEDPQEEGEDEIDEEESDD